MKKIIFWFPTVIWMVVIFAFSAHPAVQASSFDLLDFIFKKTAHFCEYFILAWLMYFSFRKSSALSKSAAIWLTLILTLAYAASDEFHQTFVPGREGRLRDVLIDSAGALGSVFLLAKK